MGKKKWLLSLAVTILLAPTLPFAQAVLPDSVAVTQTVAAKSKATSRSTVVSAIKQTPDLNPTAKARHFSQATYAKYGALFDKNYNVEEMSPYSVFGNAQKAYVYTSSPILKRYMYAAMQNWNKALGTKVFNLGTKSHKTINVKWKYNGASEEWDGMYQDNSLWINKDDFDNVNYVPDTYQAALNKEMPGADNPNSSAYKQQYINYWIAIITHELGHSLGLDHSPYTTDIMFSDSETAGPDFKYTWNRAKVDGGYAEFKNSLSQRDINRAKLTKLLGYW